MSAEEMYEKVMKTLEKGDNVEIRKKPDGSIQILGVKKHIVI